MEFKNLHLAKYLYHKLQKAVYETSLIAQNHMRWLIFCII